jgi:hypothetical protein
VKESGKLKPTTNSKRVKWFNGNVYALHAFHNNVKADSMSPSNEERASVSIKLDNRTRAQQHDVAIERSRDNTAHDFLELWRETRQAVERGDFSAILVAKKLLYLYKTRKEHDVCWRKLIGTTESGIREVNDEKWQQLVDIFKVNQV